MHPLKILMINAPKDMGLFSERDAAVLAAALYAACTHDDLQ